MSKRFLICAGHGSLRQTGWVQFDSTGVVIEQHAPFSVHDVAIDALRNGKTPDEAIDLVYEIVGDQRDFSVDISVE